MITLRTCTVALTLILAPVAAFSAVSPKLDGTRILARAAGANGIAAYTVPVDFRVKTHKIVSSVRVAGTVYYQAPAQAALVISKAPPIIGGFFRGTYNIDLVPQAWPSKYHVRSVTRDTVNGTPAYVLHAVPLGGGDVDQVLFTIALPAYAPVAASWLYSDGSRIDLTFIDRAVNGHQLPQSATIKVDMPKYKIDAYATYGEYDFGTAIDPGVFAAKDAH